MVTSGLCAVCVRHHALIIVPELWTDLRPALVWPHIRCLQSRPSDLWVTYIRQCVSVESCWRVRWIRWRQSTHTHAQSLVCVRVWCVSWCRMDTPIKFSVCRVPGLQSRAQSEGDKVSRGRRRTWWWKRCWPAISWIILVVLSSGPERDVSPWEPAPPTSSCEVCVRRQTVKLGAARFCRIGRNVFVFLKWAVQSAHQSECLLS